MIKEPNITKISILIGDTEATWQIPYLDASTPELIEAFVGLLRTQTFMESSIINAMEEYVESHKIGEEHED